MENIREAVTLVCIVGRAFLERPLAKNISDDVQVADTVAGKYLRALHISHHPKCGRASRFSPRSSGVSEPPGMFQNTRIADAVGGASPGHS